MEAGPLGTEQSAALALFREVTADGRDDRSALQLLLSCNWNVEQALQLHWATQEEEGTGSVPSAHAAGSALGALGSPLLHRNAQGQLPSGEGSYGSSGSSGPAQPAPPLRTGMLGWITRGIRKISATVFGVVCAFIFGAGGPRLGGHASGAAFSRALTAAYGEQLRLPRFFEGAFAQALQAARRDLKLLVVYLHSEHARYTQSFCTEVLGSEFISDMLNENFVLWGGDIARIESHQVAQMIHVRQYPCFCVLLPASPDEIRVIGALNGEVQVDAAVALLTACLEEMESHRSEISARREQHVEDRYLREQQDREYQEALEMDRKREEQRQIQEREQKEAQRLVEDQRRREQEELEKVEAAKSEALERRRWRAANLQAEGPDARARLSLRLPAGQRLERKFPPSATLADVYAWADCVAFLPENEGRGLEVPPRFKLKTSFPPRELTEMGKTIEELQLAGSNILLAGLEDDD